MFQKDLPLDGRQPSAACVTITAQRRQRACMMAWSLVRLCLVWTNTPELWAARTSPQWFTENANRIMTSSSYKCCCGDGPALFHSSVKFLNGRQRGHLARVEFNFAVIMKIYINCDMMPYSLVQLFQPFEGFTCLYLKHTIITSVNSEVAVRGFSLSK
jgi:hypothetical protein